MGPHLSHLPALEQLDLSYNNIGVEGARELGPYLAYLTSLQQLILRSINIGFALKYEV